MCPYAICDKPYSPLITCVPLNKLCTMCFLGNFNQYKECEKLEESNHYSPRNGEQDD